MFAHKRDLVLAYRSDRVTGHMSGTGDIIEAEGSAMPPLDAPSVVRISRIRAALAISRERMARLLDVTTRTIARLEEQDRLPSSPAVATRLAQIQEIVDLGLVIFTSEGFPRFMSTPFPVFRGLTALQLIERGELDQVWGALASLHDGNPV